jgi:hypothetical protein
MMRGGKVGGKKRGSSQETDLQQHETAKQLIRVLFDILHGKGVVEIKQTGGREGLLISLHTGFARDHFARRIIRELCQFRRSCVPT